MHEWVFLHPHFAVHTLRFISQPCVMRIRSCSGVSEGHWVWTLQLILSEKNGNKFDFSACRRSGSTSETRTSFRSMVYTSYMYSPFKTRHPHIYRKISPLIESRKHNKKRWFRNQSRITSSIAQTFLAKFKESALQLFAAPDIPKMLIENEWLRILVLCINSSESISARKTMELGLWDRFDQTVASIRQLVLSAEFLVVMFDG